jgi:hypothetical protein
MPIERVIEYGACIEDKLAQTLYYFLYITGARIREATDFSPTRLEIYDNRYAVRMKTEKQRTGDNMRKVPIPRGGLSKCHEDEMMDSILNFIVGFEAHQHLFNKWPSKAGMTCYMRRRCPEITLEARVRMPSGDYIDKTITKPFHPHYMREVRAVHLVEYYGFNNMQLCGFFNWKNPAMALKYTRAQDVWKAFKPS